MKKCELVFVVKDHSEKVVVVGEFTEKEWSNFESFYEYALELANTKIVRDGMDSSLNVKWDEEKGLQFKASLPPWDDFIVFIHKIRPFVLQSEPTYFYSECNLLCKNLKHPYFHQIIDQERRMFSGKDMQSMIQIKINEFLINSEKMLFDWLNAYEYHRDDEKRKFIEELHAVFPLDFSEGIFVSLMTDKARAIFNLGTILATVMGKQEKFEARIHLKAPP